MMGEKRVFEAEGALCNMGSECPFEAGQLQSDVASTGLLAAEKSMPSEVGHLRPRTEDA